MNTIISILILIIMGLFAIVLFILAQHKYELWEEIYKIRNR